MSKIRGQGAVITKDAVTIGRVVEIDWSESRGTVYGSTESAVKLSIILDDGVSLLRVDDVSDYVITPSATAGASLTIPSGRIDTSAMSINRGAVINTVTIISSALATVA
jgi:hypothetical protein